MRRNAFSNAAMIVLLAAPTLVAQSRMTPTAPGTVGDPVWQAVTRLSDGRLFVTDGGIAIDTALTTLAALPKKEVAGKVLETYMSKPPKDEYRFSDLTPAADGKTYGTPSGIPLNATYIDYLRRILPAQAVRFSMGAELEPVVVFVDQKAVGVLMPVRK
jgi:hypothetical protein